MGDNIKKNDIVILDNVIIGINHLVINSSMISIFQSISHDNSNGGDVHFFGENKHIEALKSIIKDKQNKETKFYSISVLHPDGGHFDKVLKWFKKLKEDKSQFVKIFDKVSQNQPKLFVITTMIPINMYRFLNKMNSKKDQRILILLHGELEYLFKDNLTLGEKIKAYFFKKVFKKAGKNIQFLVLSDYIKKTLVENDFLKKEQIISINHPLINYTRKNRDLSQPLIFSHLGVANSRKNSEVIFNLSKSIADSNAKFQLIGKVDENDISLKDENFVEVKSKDKKSISQEDYISFIESSHYSLVFLKGNEYVYRISGSVLDSVQYQLPIIAFKHHFTIELFEKGGDIGYLCENYQEMKELLIKLSQVSSDSVNRYRNQISNLEKLALQFYIENAAKIISANL